MLENALSWFWLEKKGWFGIETYFLKKKKRVPQIFDIVLCDGGLMFWLGS